MAGETRPLLVRLPPGDSGHCCCPLPGLSEEAEPRPLIGQDWQPCPLIGQSGRQGSGESTQPDNTIIVRHRRDNTLGWLANFNKRRKLERRKHLFLGFLEISVVFSDIPMAMVDVDFVLKFVN